MPTGLVTGGSQGVGRGIVEGLAESGFHVYLTGRDRTRLDAATAAAGQLGGSVAARQLDQNDDARVAELFAEIDAAGPLDLLVNNAWGGYERMVENERFTWTDPFWEQPLWRWDAMLQTGVRAAFVAAQHATRRMLGRRRGLIVNVSFWSARKHIGNALYGMAKAATDKMTADMAAELHGSGVNVLSIYPGLVRTEKVLENAAYLDLSNSESPRFVGRAIAAVFEHPTYAAEHTGEACTAAACALALGVTDVDGKQPRPLTLDDV